MTTGLPTCGEHEMLLPQTVYITPSNINPWRDVRDPDQRYTRTQLHRMRLEGIDQATVEDIIVRNRVCPRNEMYIPGGIRHDYLMPCPIIGRRERAGQLQLKVISPAGDRKWVYPDGSITRKKAWAK